jgi:hypothetical protein
MRRAPAALLLILLSLPLIAPLFASAPDESQLPACCRRNGKHHCAMYMEMGLANIPSRFVVISEKCPYSPFTHAQLMLPHVFFRARTAIVTHPTTLAQVVCETEAGFRISADRTRHKRGPPAKLTA